MAWINVHEDVVGPKLRHLAKLSGLSQNEALGTLIVLWLWGIKNADQTGFIKSADRSDVSDVISSGLTAGIKPLKVVENMIESGWIDECGGELYLHDWDEWQEMWYKYLGRREKDTARKRMAREREEPKSKPNAAPVLPEKAGEEPTPPPEEKKGGKNQYPSGFEQFWEAYPRRIDKGNAYKKYAARRKDGYSDDELVAAAKAYAAECKVRRTENEFIKHPKTFLSDTMPFTDFLPKAPMPVTADDGNPFAEWGDENG